MLRRGMIFMIGLAATSLIAGLATGIFSAHHFHRLSGYGLIANVAAMPLVTFVVMPAGLFALLAMPFGAEHLPLSLMGRGIDGVVAVAHRVADLGGDVATGQLAFAHTALMTAGLLVFVFLRTRLRHVGLIVMTIGATLALRHEPRAPDVLIAEDGVLVAIVTRDHMATNRTRPSAFIFDQWADALRQSAHLGPQTHDDPTIIDDPAATDDAPSAGSRPVARTELTAGQRRHFAASVAEQGRREDPGRFVCQRKDWCVAHFAPDRAVITVENPAYIGMACDLGAIVVTPRNLAMTQCRSGATLFSARSLRRTGAVSILHRPQDHRAGHVAHDAQAPPTHETAAPGGAVAMPSIQAAAAGSTPAPNDGNRAALRPADATLDIKTALGGVVRPWTRHRSYDWRSRSYVTDTSVAGTAQPAIDEHNDAGAPAGSSAALNDTGE